MSSKRLGVFEVKATMELGTNGSLERVAECLRVMAHPVRLRIADMCMQGELPVHEIAERCGLPPHQACEHLRLMKGHGLVESERRGREVYYRVAARHLEQLLACVREEYARRSAEEEHGRGGRARSKED